MANVLTMKYSKICRVCLRSDGELHSIADAIKPRSGVTLASIMIFYEFINEALTNDKLTVNQICRTCANTIRRLYTLLEKTEKANKILSELKAARIRLKRVNLDLKEEIPLDEAETNVQLEPPPESIRVQLEPPAENQGAIAEDSAVVSIDSSGTYCEDEKIKLQALISDKTEDKVIVQNETISAVDTKNLVSATQANILSGEEPPAKRIALDHSLDGVANDLSKAIDDAFGFELSGPETDVNRSIDVSQPDSIEDGSSKQTESSLDTLRKCRLCEEMFSVNDLEKHRMLHMTNPFEVGRLIDCRLYCLVCCAWHRGVSSLKNHAESCHGRGENYQSSDVDLENKTFQCLVCLRKNMTATNLSEHMGNHILGFPFSASKVFSSSSKYACLYCSNRYSSRNYVAQHIMTAHGSDKLRNCEICGLKDLQTPEVHNHLDAFAREYYCWKCSFSFEDAMFMSAHDLYHNGGNLKCDECRLAFVHLDQFERHEATHALLHKCPVCKKHLSSELKLKHHAYHHDKRRKNLATKELGLQDAHTISDAEIPAALVESDSKNEPEYTVIVEVDDNADSEEAGKEEEVNKIDSAENPLKNVSSMFVSGKEDLVQKNEEVAVNHAVIARKDYTATLLTPIVENVNPTSGLVISQVTSGDMVIRVGSNGGGLQDLRQKNLGQFPIQPIVVNNATAMTGSGSSLVSKPQNASQLHLTAANSPNAFNAPTMVVIPRSATHRPSEVLNNVVLPHVPSTSNQPGMEIIQPSLPDTSTCAVNYPSQLVPVRTFNVPGQVEPVAHLPSSSELAQNQTVFIVNGQDSTQRLGLDNNLLLLNNSRDKNVPPNATPNIIVRNPQHNASAVDNNPAGETSMAVNASGSVIKSCNVDIGRQSNVQRALTQNKDPISIRKLPKSIRTSIMPTGSESLLRTALNAKQPKIEQECLSAPEFLDSHTQPKSKVNPTTKAKASTSNTQQSSKVSTSQPNERPRIFVRTDLMTTKSRGDNDRRN